MMADVVFLKVDVDECEEVATYVEQRLSFNILFISEIQMICKTPKLFAFKFQRV